MSLIERLQRGSRRRLLFRVVVFLDRRNMLLVFLLKQLSLPVIEVGKPLLRTPVMGWTYVVVVVVGPTFSTDASTGTTFVIILRG